MKKLYYVFVRNNKLMKIAFVKNKTVEEVKAKIIEFNKKNEEKCILLEKKIEIMLAKYKIGLKKQYQQSIEE